MRRSLTCSGATAHWYGKEGVKKNRKVPPLPSPSAQPRCYRRHRHPSGGCPCFAERAGRGLTSLLLVVKIGHITVVGESITQALARVDYIRGITQEVAPAPEVSPSTVQPRFRMLVQSSASCNR